MRIAFISQWYEPEPGAAAHPTAIAEALARRGHDVRVLTGFPSYPTGRIYDGYRLSLRQHEHRNGVHLLRVPDSPSHDDNALRRALSLTSFAVSATSQVAWLRQADACLVYLSPATVGLAARVLRRLAGVPYVLYVQDLWPESVTASGFLGSQRATRLVERGINGFLAGLYAHSSSVAAISPGMARILEARGAGRVEVVYNWVDEGIFVPPATPAEQELDPDLVWIMYAGGIGDLQGLDAAVDALASVRHRASSRLALAFVGDGVARESLLRRVDALGLHDRVRFLGRRPMSQMPGLMAQSAAQLISLRDLPLFRVTVPSKVQTTMACAQPMICAVAGDAAQIVTESGAGVTARPGDPVSLADAFVAMADMPDGERTAMGRRGREYYLANLGSQVGAARLESQLERAAKGPGS